LAPDVPVPIGRKDQRREVVHWTIREAQSEIAPDVIYDDAWLRRTRSRSAASCSRGRFGGSASA
jgi:hypothetical protein